MKIDFVTPRFHPHVGGIEESAGQLARRLRARGHDVVVHTTRTSGLAREDEWMGVPIRRYRRRLRLGYYASRFEPELRGDIVHMHAFAHLTNDWIVLHRPPHARLFLSTHHGARFPKSLPSRLYHAFYNAAIGFRNVRRLEGLFVPTRYDTEFFASQGVAPSRIHELPSGADDRAFEPAEPWRPAGIPPDAPFALFLGRFHEEKGIEDLLRAYASGRVEMPLVAAGRDEGMVGRLREAAGANPRIVVVENPTPAQRWGLLAACHVLVLPSRHEGQGIVVAEAWAQRKPVIVSRAGALPYVVDHERDGVVVSIGDAAGLAASLHRMEVDARWAARLGAAGREKAERLYRWDSLVDRVLSVYQASSGQTSDGSTDALAREPAA